MAVTGPEAEAKTEQVRTSCTISLVNTLGWKQEETNNSQPRTQEPITGIKE
jgi:hypothetical protein